MSDIAPAPATGTARFRFKDGTVPSQEALNEWLRTLLEETGVAAFVDVVEDDASSEEIPLPTSYGTLRLGLEVVVGPRGGDDIADDAALAFLQVPAAKLARIGRHLICLSERAHIAGVRVRRPA